MTMLLLLFLLTAIIRAHTQTRLKDVPLSSGVRRNGSPLADVAPGEEGSTFETLRKVVLSAGCSRRQVVEYNQRVIPAVSEIWRCSCHCSPKAVLSLSPLATMWMCLCLSCSGTMATAVHCLALSFRCHSPKWRGEWTLTCCCVQQWQQRERPLPLTAQE